MSKLQGLRRLQSFRLYFFEDIKVGKDTKVAKVGDFHTLSFSPYQGYEECESCKVSDFIIFIKSRLRVLQRLQNFRLYQFQDNRVATVAKFQTLPFSGYQNGEGCKVSEFIILGYLGCEGPKGCKISDFIIFRTSRL